MRMLNLALQKKWFDLIAAGDKKFEFREDNPYWSQRLIDKNGIGKEFDIVRFRNGYHKDAPVMDVEFKGISFTSPKFYTPKHGEVLKGNTIVIRLGKVLSITA